MTYRQEVFLSGMLCGSMLTVFVMGVTFVFTL